jgi:Mn2+/Fe2+ NRAMP family transporter
MRRILPLLYSKAAAGNTGMRFFGLVMWCAALTSVIGASYTSLSFFKTLHPYINKHLRSFITLFICISTVFFLVIGNPVKLLLMAGAVNGMILPLALSLILVAASKQRIIGDYRHPAGCMWRAGW